MGAVKAKAVIIMFELKKKTSKPNQRKIYTIKIKIGESVKHLYLFKKFYGGFMACLQ